MGVPSFAFRFPLYYSAMGKHESFSEREITFREELGKLSPAGVETRFGPGNPWEPDDVLYHGSGGFRLQLWNESIGGQQAFAFPHIEDGQALEMYESPDRRTDEEMDALVEHMRFRENTAVEVITSP